MQMMLGAVRKPVAHVFLPSPSEPLINPRASLREFAAVHLGKCASPAQPSAFASSSSARSFIAWSAKELVKIQKPGEPGDGVRVEKPLLDAFYPFNATLSIALAGLNGAMQELTRSGKINDFANYIAGDVDEDDDDRPPPGKPFEWDRVGHDTAVGFTRDVVGQTLTRCIEIAGKPRLTASQYAELLKHPHKAARVALDAERASGARGLVSSYRAGALVATSPTFFIVRGMTCYLADVFVDSIAWYRGQMSSKTFMTNATLKSAKHAIFNAFCLAIGFVVPFVSPNFYLFVALEQLGAQYATDALICQLGTIEPS